MREADREENCNQGELFVDREWNEADNKGDRIKINQLDKELREELFIIPKNHSDFFGIKKVFIIKAEHKNHFWVDFQH